MISCVCCGVLTPNPKFCSRSCSAKVSNKVKPKRTSKTYSCTRCGCQVTSRRTVCDDCLVPKDMTLEEGMYTLHHPSSAFALVRSRARVVTKDWPKVCTHCGYSKHVEVCHIKAVSEYPLDTKLSVINDPSNLILLCPNCHWEFDHPNHSG
jgi:hypothetical protein